MKQYIKSRVICAGIVLTTCLMSANTLVFAELTPYAIDLHLHGLSNHNAGAHPASMEYQTVQAVSTGYVDVLWWTDHTRVFDQWKPFSFNTGTSGVEEGSLDITGLSLEGTSNATHLAAKLTGGNPSVQINSGLALIQLQADARASEFQFLTYEAKDSRHRLDRVSGFNFNRPLSSEPIVDVELACDSPDVAAICEVEFGLAWHHEGEQPVQQTITYRIDSQASTQTTFLLTPWHVQIVIPPQTGGHYLFDLLHDTSLLKNGDDNTISRFILRVGARSGALASMTFRGIKITSEKPSDLHQIGAFQGLAQRYERLFGLPERLGLEYGTEDGHINGFLPRPLDSRDLDLFDVVQGVRIPLGIKNWASRIHDKGGVVSLNHPFGPHTTCGFLPPDQCILDRAQKILETNAYGADLLEVGYINRGLSLRHHLDLWDILTANELLLYGVGVSDNHGLPWKQFRTYVTWVLSPSAEPSDLLDSLEAGQIYFGNPKVWKGTFAFQVGDASMGDRIANPGDRSLIQFQLDPWPEPVQVFLVQGLIKPGMEVEYLHERTPLIQGQTMFVDTSRPSFVRLEAYEAFDEVNDLSKPAIFTNPVTMLPNPNSVSGIVFEDLNGNGVFNENESPLKGARMILRSAGLNDIFDPGGDDVFMNTWTNVDGAYNYTELLPGRYLLQSVTEYASSIPANAVLTTAVNPHKFILSDGDKLSTLNFGYSQLQAINTDGDSFEDRVGNCTDVANSDQHDSDNDGYGNMCDGDLKTMEIPMP